MRRRSSCASALALCLALGARAEDAPRRIVSTAPSVTETLFALGVGDRVVGVTIWCRHPEEARAKPKIGGYGTPNLEAILALRPDLVVLGNDRSDIALRLDEMKIPTLEVRVESLGDIEDSIRRIASRLGVSARGEALTARIEAQRAAVAQAVTGRPRARTLLLLGHSPGALAGLYAVGPKSFLGEMLAAAGGENVLADVWVPYPRISVEEVIRRDPDVILAILSPPVDATDAATRAREWWSAYPSLKAVRNGAIRVVVDDTMVQPGPRLGEKIAILAEALYGVRP